MHVFFFSCLLRGKKKVLVRKTWRSAQLYSEIWWVYYLKWLLLFLLSYLFITPNSRNSIYGFSNPWWWQLPTQNTGRNWAEKGNEEKGYFQVLHLSFWNTCDVSGVSLFIYLIVFFSFFSLFCRLKNGGPSPRLLSGNVWVRCTCSSPRTSCQVSCRVMSCQVKQKKERERERERSYLIIHPPCPPPSFTRYYQYHRHSH